MKPPGNRKNPLRVEVFHAGLHRGVADAIKDHSRKEADKGGFEAVGFVACDNALRLGVAVVPLHNHSPDPRHSFFVEPWEQFRAEERLKDEGYTILGVYHSHPSSEALPSQSDHKKARPDEFYFLYSVVFDDLKAYKKIDQFLEPVELTIDEE